MADRQDGVAAGSSEHLSDEGIYGLVDWMREADVKIGKVRLVTEDGEPVVVLIGHANRADDLEAAYDALNVETVIGADFDPPVRLER